MLRRREMTWLVLGGVLAPALARRALAAGKVPRIGAVFPGVQGPSGQAFEKALSPPKQRARSRSS